ncbi:hypothetical protein BV22DRAFT_901880 [Leucogyrophana mollusca]|uniref:Uncharacterized protein n=1 Tax=Leucogyrophana mollusca TaxID=85980 RepID=A0ACB8B083_9AGAM|nr:hypothetical protein BV22DRAFT_901880 [Leucogyrophana mollusca]
MGIKTRARCSSPRKGALCMPRTNVVVSICVIASVFKVLTSHLSRIPIRSQSALPLDLNSVLPVRLSTACLIDGVVTSLHFLAHVQTGEKKTDLPVGLPLSHLEAVRMACLRCANKRSPRAMRSSSFGYRIEIHDRTASPCEEKT